MPALRNLVVSLLLLASGVPLFGAGQGGHEAASSLQGPLGLPISNAVLTSFIVTALAILGIRALVGKPGVIPTRGQAVFETLITALRDMFEPIVGKKAMPAAFPVLLCFFIFILLHNWSGLIPFVGTAGWGYTDPATGEFVLTNPLLRPHTSDANGTLALALVSFGAWLIIIFKYAGPRVVFHDLFGNKVDKGEMHGGMYAFLSVIFFLVGIIEIVSILIRPVTLTARLFGNIYGGENLLHATSFVFAFYFLEIIVGFVQAFVFTLLSAVYIGLICNHGDDHDHAHADAHGSEAEAHPVTSGTKEPAH